MPFDAWVSSKQHAAADMAKHAMLAGTSHIVNWERVLHHLITQLSPWD